MRSLSSAVAGLRTHQTKMDVIGNNIANVNTYGFKSSRATFSDVYYQTINSGRMTDSVRGGMNPTQIGYGAKLATIDILMTNGGGAYTGRPHDAYIDGDGFFVVQDASGRNLYSRMGNFSVIGGYLVDHAGNFVMGVPLSGQGYLTGEAAATGDGFFPGASLQKIEMKDTQVGRLLPQENVNPGAYPFLPAPHANYNAEHAALWGKDPEWPADYNGGVWPMTFEEFITARKDAAIDPAVLTPYRAAENVINSLRPEFEILSGNYNRDLAEYQRAMNVLDNANADIIRADIRVQVFENVVNSLTGSVPPPGVPAIIATLLAQRDAYVIGTSNVDDIRNGVGGPYTPEEIGIANTVFSAYNDAIERVQGNIDNATTQRNNALQEQAAANIAMVTADVDARIAFQSLWNSREALFADTADAMPAITIIPPATTLTSTYLNGLMEGGGHAPTNAVPGAANPPDANSVFETFNDAAEAYSLALTAYENAMNSANNQQMQLIRWLEDILELHNIDLPGQWGRNDWETVSGQDNVLTNISNLMEARGYNSATGLYQQLYDFFMPQPDGSGWVSSYETGNGMPADAKGHPSYIAVDHAGWTITIGPGDEGYPAAGIWDPLTGMTTKNIYDAVTSISIASDGSIMGITLEDLVYEGNIIPKNRPIFLGKLAIATFTNQDGLSQVGGSFYSTSASSGDPRYTTADTNGSGATMAGYLEMSNVEISQQFTDMITTQRGFQANTRIVTVSDEMLQELVNMKR